MSQTEKIQTLLPPAAPPPHPTAGEVEARHVSPDANIGLGSEVVYDMVAHAFGGNPDNISSAEMYGSRLEAAAEPVRAQLEALTPEQRMTVNRVFGSHQVSPWVEAKLGLDGKPQLFQDFVGALTAKDKDGKPRVGNIELLNFLEWHNHAMVGEQTELNQRAPAIKREFGDAFINTVAKGWLPQNATGNLQRLDDALLLMDDGFYSTVHDTLGLAFDAQDPRTGQYHVIFAPGEDKDRDTRFHELNHVAEGKAHVWIEKDGKEELHTIGGVEQLFGWDIGGQALREAINSQFTDGMIHGRMRVLDPAARVRRHAAYPEARVLLHTLAEKGFKKIDFKLFLAAQYEDGVEAERLGDDSAQARLDRELVEAFPFTDVPREIAQLHTHDGEDADAVLLQYAHNLAARVAKRRTVAKRVADTALLRDVPQYAARHKADGKQKSRENSPAEIAARIRDESRHE